MSRNIVFIAGHFGVGGVEKVTVTLANAFVAQGNKVAIVAFHFDEKNMLSALDARVMQKQLSFPAFTIKNLKILKSFLHDFRCDIIINQWALPFLLTFMLWIAKSKDCKLLAVHHTVPNRNRKESEAKSIARRCFWRVFIGFNLHLVYVFSNKYIVLSSSYVPILKSYAWLLSVDKCVSIPNPVQINVDSDMRKHNAILYVGRLALTEKRVDRVIDIWRKVCMSIPDWRLDIVGDGPDRKCLEQMATGLPRICFHGFQSPDEFYNRSKILLLTSEFEGFPMVLVEAMSCGCVPVYLDSYPAARDIARDGKILLPTPFDPDAFLSSIRKLVSNSGVLSELSINARSVQEDYSTTSIVQKWNNLFVRC